MTIDFGREICGELDIAQTREWLVTNGRGSYASGTVAGLLTRTYHGLLIAALNPPGNRTLLVTKLDDTAQYHDRAYPLFSNRWQGGTIDPQGYGYIERFHLEGLIPVWSFALGDALLEKRIWMEPGANTTYIHYQLQRATDPLTLTLRALVNYRSHHGGTERRAMTVEAVEQGIRVTAFAEAVPYFLLRDLLSNPGQVNLANEWYTNFELEMEAYRGLNSVDDHLYGGTFTVTIAPHTSFTLVASTEAQPDLNGEAALDRRRTYEQQLLDPWHQAYPGEGTTIPDWIDRLVLAADQFVVDRPLENNQMGKTVIAGYHWFDDWGRDTMISLPGLTLTTGRPAIARQILTTFAQYISQGMLPNRFPDGSSQLGDSDYNTVDATLWYFEAIRHYYATTQDQTLVEELFPKLQEIITWHRQGTRYNIKLDTTDGLISAGQAGVQLTWMDAKVGDLVVTPRMGKPVEISALWYNALRSMAQFAHLLGQSPAEYDTLAEQTLQGFQRFWNAEVGYCFDVLDGPDGKNDATFRPNQLFAVSLPDSPLTADQQRSVVEVCGQFLLTSHGLRSLVESDSQYQGHYGGDQFSRDGAYHQGTVWGWLIGPFVFAHLKVFQNPTLTRQFLEPMAYHLRTVGLGTISEIFDGDAPFYPRGCLAQAWSVAEVLRAWVAVTTGGQG